MSSSRLTRAQRLAGLMAIAATVGAPTPAANVAPATAPAVAPAPAQNSERSVQPVAPAANQQVQMIGGFGLVRNLIPRSGRPWPWWVGAGKRKLTYQSRVARRAR